MTYWPVGDMCFIQYHSLPPFASDHPEVEWLTRLWATCVLFNTAIYLTLPQITKKLSDLLACGRRVFYSILQFTSLCLRSPRSGVAYLPVGDMCFIQYHNLPHFASDHPEVEWLAYWPVGINVFYSFPQFTLLCLRSPINEVAHCG